MTTCAECLTAVSTMRLTDMRPGSPVAIHCETCPDCASVVGETTYAEKRLAGALREMNPGMSADDLTTNALRGSERIRRKEVARWARGLIAAAGCVMFWFFVQDVLVPWTDGAKRTAMETITLKCLTAEQASEIATPYLRSSGSAIYLEKDIHSITIRGRADEFVRAKTELKGVDGKQHCDLPAPAIAGTPVPTPSPTTSSDIPGKD